MNRKIKTHSVFIVTLTLTFVLSCYMPDWLLPEDQGEPHGNGSTDTGAKTELVTVVNENVPYFTDADKASTEFFETHEPLDELGRVGVAFARISYENMPTEERDFSLKTKPTGWVQVRYSVVSGGWLYNRAHIIGYQLTGGKDDPLNLMTGTREFNTPGMLQFENITADHMKDRHNHHILYRVTPDFGEGDNLLAYGVLMESDCIECDDADYCVYIANIQTGVVLDYATGNSSLAP